MYPTSIRLCTKDTVNIPTQATQDIREIQNSFERGHDWQYFSRRNKEYITYIWIHKKSTQIDTKLSVRKYHILLYIFDIPWVVFRNKECIHLDTENNLHSNRPKTVGSDIFCHIFWICYTLYLINMKVKYFCHKISNAVVTKNNGKCVSLRCTVNMVVINVVNIDSFTPSMMSF